MPTSAERAARARKAHSGAGPQKRWPVMVGAGIALLLGSVIVALSLGASGEESPEPNASGHELALGRTATVTRDLEKRPGGLLEGAKNLTEPSTAPPTSERRAAGGRRFALPLKAYAGIEDYFATPRLYGMRHAGIDFSLAGLSNVVVASSCDGTVLSTGQTDELGMHVIVDCRDGWSTVYGFLQSLNVNAGDVLKQGAEVGRGAAGEHLHFEIRFLDAPVDPEGYVDVPPRETPTPTPTATSTIAPTKAAAANSTPIATAINTSTPAPAPPTPTPSNTPTITPTPTWTLTPTRTPQKAATPTPPPPISR